ALSLFMAGQLFGGNGLAVALTAGIATIACISVGATLAKGYQAEATGVVIAAAGGLPFAFVAGFTGVPGLTIRANLLLGSGLVVIVSAVAIMVMGAGITTFIAAATAGFIGVLAFTVATLVAHPAPG